MVKKVGMIKVLNEFRKQNDRAYQKLLEGMDKIYFVKLTPDEQITYVIGEREEFEPVEFLDKGEDSELVEYIADYRFGEWHFKKKED